MFIHLDANNIPGFGPDTNIKIVNKVKNNKLKALFTNEEESFSSKVDKTTKEKEINLIDLVPRYEEPENNISQIINTSNQLKLLVEGKYVEPKKPDPIKNNVLKKKFKVNLNDLPSI